MYYGLNYLTLGGRLAAKPTLNKTKSGVSVCHFRVIANAPSYKRGEEYVDRPPFAIDCTAWRNTADYIAREADKGMVISGIFSLSNNRTERERDGVRTVFNNVNATPLNGTFINLCYVANNADGQSVQEKSSYQVDDQEPDASAEAATPEYAGDDTEIMEELPY